MMNITTIALLVLAPLLVWRVYLRIKAMMQSQRSILSRHYTGLIVFAGMVLIAGSEVATRPALLGWLAVGTAAGIAYAIWGLRLTRFDNTTLFYAPNARLGMVIAMLFVARVLYIGVDIYANQNSGVPTPGFTESELTLLAIGLTGGYFGTYSAGLIRWRRALDKAIRKS